MLKSIVLVADFVNVIEVELFIGKVKHNVCETLSDISIMWFYGNIDPLH